MFIPINNEKIKKKKMQSNILKVANSKYTSKDDIALAFFCNYIIINNFLCLP